MTGTELSIGLKQLGCLQLADCYPISRNWLRLTAYYYLAVCCLYSSSFGSVYLISTNSSTMPEELPSLLEPHSFGRVA